jgi:hypothetical protein
MDHVLLETIIINQIKSYRGNDFQDFGDRLLSKLYPAEYTPVRAGGPWGDLKNDGYCFVNRTFFHFYGSSQYNVSKLKGKITSDIEGCLAKQLHVRKVIYVTNESSLGVIEAHIDGLRLKHAIDIETWGPAKLVEIMQSLSRRDVASVLKLSLTDVIKTEGPTGIIYSIDESSVEIISRQEAKKRSKVNIEILIGALMVGLIAGVLLPWFFFVFVAAFLLLFIRYIPWHIREVFIKASEGEYQHGKDFYVLEGDHYKRYRKTALCSYPTCKGVVYLEIPSGYLKKRYKVIGCCSSDSIHHTFTYDIQNTGKPVAVYAGDDEYASETDRIIADVIKTEGKMKATEKYMNLTGHTLQKSKETVDGISRKYALPDGGSQWGLGCAVLLLLLSIMVYMCW